MPTAVHLAKNR